MKALTNEFAGKEMKFVIAKDDDQLILVTAKCETGSNKVKHKELVSSRKASILGGARMEIRDYPNKEGEKYLFVFGTSMDFGLPPEDKMRQLVLKAAKKHSDITAVTLRAHDYENPEYWVRDNNSDEWVEWEG